MAKRKSEWSSSKARGLCGAWRVCIPGRVHSRNPGKSVSTSAVLQAPGHKLALLFKTPENAGDA